MKHFDEVQVRNVCTNIMSRPKMLWFTSKESHFNRLFFLGKFFPNYIRRFAEENIACVHRQEIHAEKNVQTSIILFSHSMTIIVKLQKFVFVILRRHFLAKYITSRIVSTAMASKTKNK